MTAFSLLNRGITSKIGQSACCESRRFSCAPKGGNPHDLRIPRRLHGLLRQWAGRGAAAVLYGGTVKSYAQNRFADSG